jgi:hypothetical protein
VDEKGRPSFPFMTVRAGGLGTGGYSKNEADVNEFQAEGAPELCRSDHLHDDHGDVIPLGNIATENRDLPENGVDNPLG